MERQHIVTHEMIYEHGERMQNIRKYYPFFRLMDTSFSQYREGQYACLDMAYIVMALLRFFIEENNFNDKPVTYAEYQTFVCRIFRRDFELVLLKEEEEELAGYLFDKIRNEGKPFSYEYFDPADKKRRTVRTRLIDSRMEGENVVYYITGDAIEFYLDTKEIKEESSINVAQILLEKLIRSQNFSGGVEVVRRINNEVSRLQARRDEVITLLGNDVFEGMKAYEDFVEKGIRWFAEEQKLFKRNRELIENALKRAQEDGLGTIRQLYQLDLELKRAIQKHSELLAACTDLQQKADDLLKRAKLSRLRSSFQFKDALNKIMSADRADMLSGLVQPLFAPRLRKSFTFLHLEDMLTYSPLKEEKGEKLPEGRETLEYVFEDEREDERIHANYGCFIRALLSKLGREERFTLSAWNEELKDEFGQEIFKNGDYYSFLVHMSQKKEYCVAEVRKKPQTFFEEIMKETLEGLGEEYDALSFRLQPGSEEDMIKLMDIFEVSEITFERSAE